MPLRLVRLLGLAIVYGSLWGPVEASGRDLHVDPVAGDDAHDGAAQPVRTIARAIRLAEPGDTIHLRPKIYHDYAGFHGKHGQPGRPITLDGHGATLEGSDPLDPAAWTEVGPGLFRNENLVPRLNQAILGRWFFLFDGCMQHMGRTSKGTHAPFKPPEALQPGEWTFVPDANRQEPGASQVDGAFYVCIPPGTSLAEARIRAPLRSAGVQLSGENSHLAIRNLTATHPYNDGFNIHGTCRDVVFENIRAVECGDDGISAHDDCQYRVDGLASIGNSTGICDVGQSVTAYDRVLIRDCLGFDLYFLDTGRYSVSNALVRSSAERTLHVVGRSAEGAPCRLTLDNVLIRREPGPRRYADFNPEVKRSEVRISPNSVFTARRLTLLDVDLQATGGEVTLDHCYLGGEHPPAVLLWKDVTWRGRGNRYDLASLRVEQTSFTPQTFGAFQQRVAEETGSAWRRVTTESSLPPETGADPSRLPQPGPALAK